METKTKQKISDEEVKNKAVKKRYGDPF